VRGIRPRQWSKNILVLAAPVAAGIAFQPQAVLEMGVAVLAFILASSGVYLVNDAVDVEADRAHPTKRLRPVAAGELSAREASTAAVVLLAGGLAVSALLGWQLFAIVALYEAAQILYCLGMQNVPVVELVSVAFGFLLRAIAGGVATGVELSPWFLVAVGFGSLFVAAGKRYSEMLLAQDATAAIRPVLARYTSSYLRFAVTLSAVVLVTTYALWSATVGQAEPNPWTIVSILPVVLAVLRYARKIDAGDAGEPVEAILGDGVMLLLVSAWALCFMAAVYL
jgi:decaprenyl-phosphate phosphoribosyltransferase